MAQLQFPDILGQFRQGQQVGQAQRANRLAGQAFASQGADRQSALSQLAGLDPRAAMGMQSQFQQQDAQAQQNQQAQQVDHAKKLNGAANYMLQAVQSNDPARVQGAWQSVRPYLAEVSGKQPPDQFDPAMLPKIYEILGQTGGTPQQKGTVVAPGGALVDSATGQQMFANPAAPANGQLVDIPDGQGGTVKMLFDPRTRQLSQPNYGGAQQAPQGQPASQGPDLGAINARAGELVNSGQLTPEQGDAWIQQQYQSAGMQPTGQGAPASAPSGGLGHAPAKTSGALDQRIALARQMGATDDQVKQMVLGQAATTEANQPLSSGDERMANALANYQLPAGARFISTKANRAIVQRALELNPQLSTANYDQSHKFLQDLASNSPTSAGGVVTAAKTAINHLSDLADLSDKLPSSLGFINAGENAASTFFNGANADTLKEWNTAKSKVAAEVLKMVKGGQINESESKEMINDLDPNSPNRNAAIATLAKLMTDKTDAMEQKRDSILGATSPHTSYLSASDQKKALRLIGLSKNLEPPQFQSPGGYGQSVPGAQQPAQSSPPQGGGWSIQRVN